MQRIALAAVLLLSASTAFADDDDVSPPEPADDVTPPEAPVAEDPVSPPAVVTQDPVTDPAIVADDYVAPPPAVVADRELDRPATSYFAGGAITGDNQLRYTGFFLESGHQLGARSLFGRVMGVAGATHSTERPGRGTYREARAGLEGRTCTLQGRYCGSLGLDVGWHRGDFTDYSDPFAPQTQKPGNEPPQTKGPLLDGMVLAPRLTFDGGNRARVRGVIEFPTQINDQGTTTGVAVSLALGLAF